MKIKGIKRGHTIELLEQISDIPDGTEITIVLVIDSGVQRGHPILAPVLNEADEVNDQQLISSEGSQKKLETFLDLPRDEEAIEDLAATIANMEAEEREMLELYYGSRDELADDEQRPLTSFIGAAKGSFTTPEEVDQFIRQERDAWES